MGPSPLRRAKPTGSHRPANANLPMSALRGGLLSCAASSEEQAASKATFPSRSSIGGWGADSVPVPVSVVVVFDGLQLGSAGSVLPALAPGNHRSGGNFLAPFSA
jgi:hypothetical protein